MAVIDIGSNSIRLVVFAGSEPLPVPLFNEKAACGLARGMAQTGRLHGPAVTHAMDSLDRFLRLTRLMKVERLELLATAAVRDAEDGADFVVIGCKTAQELDASDLQARAIELDGRFQTTFSFQDVLKNVVPSGVAGR